jgi:sulfhydrogenase subunit beta (sulfur reductase)
MSKRVFIRRDSLTSILEKLSRDMNVWVPVECPGDKSAADFQLFRPGMAPILDRRSTSPPKKVLLPQVETLLRFEYLKAADDASKMKVNIDDSTDTRSALVFGSRPCDVKGFLVLDRVFTGGPFADKYYRERREKTLFATLFCQDADNACFCSSVGSGPADMEGSDLSITPAGDGYLIEALNEKALPILDMMDGAEPSNDQAAEAERVRQETGLRRVGDGDLTGASRAFGERFQDIGYWQDAAGQCLSCGICTYLCPTCYCFTITDEKKGMQGERIRSWDSCMFFHYTLEASGHNPRPTKLERYRNRVGHKFSYIPDKYDGLVGCCGCGRCIRGCPVSIDIRKVVEHLRENACECK